MQNMMEMRRQLNNDRSQSSGHKSSNPNGPATAMTAMDMMNMNAMGMGSSMPPPMNVNMNMNAMGMGMGMNGMGMNHMMSNPLSMNAMGMNPSMGNAMNNFPGMNNLFNPTTSSSSAGAGNTGSNAGNMLGSSGTIMNDSSSPLQAGLAGNAASIGGLSNLGNLGNFGHLSGMNGTSSNGLGGMDSATMHSASGGPSADMMALMQAKADLAKMQATFQAQRDQLALSKLGQDSMGGQASALASSGLGTPSFNPSMSNKIMDMSGGMSSQLDPFSNLPVQDSSASAMSGNGSNAGVKRSFNELGFPSVKSDALDLPFNEDGNITSSKNGSRSGASLQEQGSEKRQRKGKKPSDMPRRALSAYNIFFSEQRELILKEIDAKENGRSSDLATSESASSLPSASSAERPKVLNRTFFPKRVKRPHRKVHGKIGLVALARTVSKRWKELSDEKRKYYQGLAAEDKKRHKQAMIDYKERKAAESMLTVNDSEGDESSQVSNALMPNSSNPAVRSNPLGNGNVNVNGLDGNNGLQNISGSMDGRGAAHDNMIEQYQQRLLAEMMGVQRMNNMGGQSGRHDFELMVQQRLNNFGGAGSHQQASSSSMQQQQEQASSSSAIGGMASNSQSQSLGNLQQRFNPQFGMF